LRERGRLGVERRLATGKNPFMKSAYELAMERLESQSPTKQLSGRQKEEIAEIESATRARIAERELLLQGEMAKAMGSGKLDEAEGLQKQLAMDIRRLTEESETKKAKVRGAGAA
jgi:hypothetical protein